MNSVLIDNLKLSLVVGCLDRLVVFVHCHPYLSTEVELSLAGVSCELTTSDPVAVSLSLGEVNDIASLHDSHTVNISFAKLDELVVTLEYDVTLLQKSKVAFSIE